MGTESHTNGKNRGGQKQDRHTNGKTKTQTDRQTHRSTYRGGAHLKSDEFANPTFFSVVSVVGVGQ